MLFKTKTNPLDAEIERVSLALGSETPGTEKYAILLQNLDELTKMRGIKPKVAVSPDTILAVSANLLGLVLIMNYERLNVLSTKALGFVLKGRI